MAWGYGKVAYGPWRVAQALDDCDAGRKLLDVVNALTNEGPEAAYRLHPWDEAGHGGPLHTDCKLLIIKE
jgi:hypothetical protein